MARIEAKMTRVFYAPTKRRRYLTPLAAARAEASSMVAKKYESERPDFDDSGRQISDGYHFTEDERLVRLRDRLARLLLRQLRKSNA